MHRRVLFITVLVATALALSSSSQTRRVERSLPNVWFANLDEEDEQQHRHQLAIDGVYRPQSAVVAQNHLCCHTVSFQQDIGGEPVSHATLPFDYWWREAGIRISVSTSLGSPAVRTVRLIPSGLLLSASSGLREVFVRVQCSYACCVEGAAVTRPQSVQRGDVRVFAGAANEGDQYEANLVSRSHQSVFAALLPHQRHEHGVMDYVSGGASDEYVWYDEPAPHHDPLDEHRYRSLKACDRDGGGLYLRITLPVQGEYALSLLDLCFVDTKLLPHWDSKFCQETD